MSYDNVFEKIVNIFAMVADTDDEITAESELIEDLGISSMDILLMISSLEEEFAIKVSEKEIRKMFTINDVVDTVVRLSE